MNLNSTWITLTRNFRIENCHKGYQVAWIMELIWCENYRQVSNLVQFFMFEMEKSLEYVLIQHKSEKNSIGIVAIKLNIYCALSMWGLLIENGEIFTFLVWMGGSLKKLHTQYQFIHILITCFLKYANAW